MRKSGSVTSYYSAQAVAVRENSGQCEVVATALCMCSQLHWTQQKPANGWIVDVNMLIDSPKQTVFQT